MCFGQISFHGIDLHCYTPQTVEQPDSSQLHTDAMVLLYHEPNGRVKEESIKCCGP